MGKKDRRKKSKAAAATPEPENTASPDGNRFTFFVWITSFFFFAALVIRLDVITAWPGAESYALDHALSNERGESMLSFLYGTLLPAGEGIDDASDAIFLFPRLLSSLALLLTGFFTYRMAGKLFGKRGVRLGLLAVAASLWLPFFGKVATPDAWALLGQAGFLWCTFLTGADRESNYLLPAGIFLFLASVAAPLPSLVFGIGVILSGRLIFGGSKTWMSMLTLLAFPVLLLLIQGVQGERTYWNWGMQPLAYGRFLAYSVLGFAPLIGFTLAGLRDTVFKFRRGEKTAKLYLAALGVGFLVQSLVVPLILALLTGRQMQLYFEAKNYPWKDWVRGGATLHVVATSIAAILVLIGIGVSFPGNGFRATLGMAAAYWIFSLLSVIGLYGDKRDFSLGGGVLAGALAVLFFWVQVYPYFEAERAWPKRLVEKIEVPLPVHLNAEQRHDLSPALPYFRRAGIPIAADSLAADFYLSRYETTDSLRATDLEVPGRVVFRTGVFGVER